jgi:hypothetical protein
MYYASLIEAEGRHKPDLLIGICGGSMAASIVAKFAHLEPKDQVKQVKEFIGSKEMHKFLKSFQACANRGKLKNSLSSLIRQIKNQENRHYPNLAN